MTINFKRMGALSVALGLFLSTSSAQAAQTYFRLDGRWYGGDVGAQTFYLSQKAFDTLLNASTCRRPNGSGPVVAPLNIVFGATYDITLVFSTGFKYYAPRTLGEPRFYTAETPYGDVSCQGEITPPAAVIARIESIENQLFRNGFEGN